MGSSIAFSLHYELSKIFIAVKFKLSYYWLQQWIYIYIVILQNYFGSLAALDKPSVLSLAVVVCVMRNQKIYLLKKKALPYNINVQF